MVSAKTSTAFRASGNASAAISKIKQKILNTSSFFKVSLKTNNRALARTLEAQKARGGQLEKDVVHLQKQVVALSFELAARRHQHRRLLLLLRVLHSDTLERLSEAAELLEDLECPEQSEDHRSRAVSETRLQDPARSRSPVLDSSGVTAATRCEETRGRGAGASPGDRRRSHDPDLPTLSCSSVSPGVGEELPHAATQGFDVNAASDPREPLGRHLPAKSPSSPDGRGEETVLLRGVVEMTPRRDSVTVETRAEKTSRSRRAKGPTVRTRCCRDPQSRDAETTRPAGRPTPKDVRDTTVPERPPPDLPHKTCAPSGVPELDGHRDRVKHPNDEKQPDVDDCFSVPNVRSDLGDNPPQVSSRRSRTKVKRASSVTWKTINPPSVDHPDSTRSTSSNQPPPEEFQSCEDEETRQVPPCPPGSVDPQTVFSAVNYSRGSNRSRRHSTVSIVRDSTSPGPTPQDQDPVPPAGSGPDARRRDGSGKSRKRPPTAAEELLGDDDLQGPPPMDRPSPEGPHVQNCKRPRRDEVGRSNKTKPKRHVDHHAHEMVKVKTMKRTEGNDVHDDRPRLCTSPSRTSQTRCPSPDTGPELHGLSDWTLSGSRVRRSELRKTFVVVRETGPGGHRNPVWSPDTAVHGLMGDLLMDEPPPWLDEEISAVDVDVSSSTDCKMEGGGADLDSSAGLVDPGGGGAVEPFHGTVPKGQVLATLTNTVTSLGGEPPGRTRRSHQQVSYKEPPLNRKLRREESGMTTERRKKKKTSRDVSGVSLKD